MNTPMPTPLVVGAGPVIRALCEEIGLVEAVNQTVAWDAQRCHLSPGERIFALIVNLLTARQPLYRVHEQFQLTDVPLLFGSGRTAADFTDDALGRALDKVAAAGGATVFSAVATRALVHDHVWTPDHPVFVHWDSTTRSVYGTYPDPDSASGVHPTYGHSKDHRPDLRQILLTLLGTREGIPVVGTVQDGNLSDKTLNAEMIAALDDYFSPQQLQQLVYVADSALVTGPNLKAMADRSLRFLSRCPDTFRAAQEAKTAALAANAWVPLGKIGERTDATSYAAAEQTGHIEGRSYRLVVYRSDHLAERKAHTIARQIDRAYDQLTRAATRLAGTVFACAHDAEAAVAAWQATAQWHHVEATVVAETQVTQRATRGRPRHDAPDPATTTVYRVRPTIGAVDAQRVQAAQDRAATFVLITNLPSTPFDARRLLEEYKGQTVIEQRFRFLKDPTFVDALYVQKPERVEALGYVLLLAALVLSLIERRARQAPPLPTPTRGLLARPTGQEVLHHLRGLIVMPLDAQTRQLFVPAVHTQPVAAILAALGFTDTIYTQVPSRPSG
ncbi:Transposase [Sulfobacillus thermosulfidooxidans DSM 9293]|uniref:Transposase n=2 Tax=Sulfobacillus thermosulfidooxidans (strain DSM 9293 / VKM B-1269 / AT-1) TaxID=929705 RepID=A0A1W1WBS0_SULTA|nr:IS1634 family transposase [Sulfobacillus thermosulfidooxidans]SMC03499.1 Transposase [Sulfobacillus thermosulfidooxidans DSM 9293]SMC03736.1 Transposase [Sulfobacillus thermosulfidooxidans DSM 9293]